MRHLALNRKNARVSVAAAFDVRFAEGIGESGNRHLISEATMGATFSGVVYRPIEGELLPFGAVWSPRSDNPAFRRPLIMAWTLSKRATADGSQITTTILP